jgi:hypothetical protein
LLFVVFALRPRGIEVRLAIEHVEEPALAAIGVATVGGDLVPDALVSTADGLVTLRLPRKGEYDLSIAAPGILDYRDRVNFEGDRAEPYRIQTDPSARLRLEIEEMERLVRLEITQPASEGELKVVYAWSRSDSSAPARLDHNLVPGVRHRVEAVYESGEPRGYSTMAMVGKVETVQIRP